MLDSCGNLGLINALVTWLVNNNLELVADIHFSRCTTVQRNYRQLVTTVWIKMQHRILSHYLAYSNKPLNRTLNSWTHSCHLNAWLVWSLDTNSTLNNWRYKLKLVLPVPAKDWALRCWADSLWEWWSFPYPPARRCPSLVRTFQTFRTFDATKCRTQSKTPNCDR